MESPLVRTDNGMLQGKLCKTFYGKSFYSFEGIPYAKPPVGDLRFKNPEPPEPWSGIRDATKPGDKCMQYNPFSDTLDGAEDCLYLNVYTPSLPAEKIQKLPSIFFIHGGSLVFGSGNIYKPDYLIKNDVILVTVNYRLSILGWLCLNLPECPGNAGLKDAAMALKWVHRNIRYFNGDQDNITVFGESAGGAMATSLLTSKMTDGLVSKVVASSGSSISQWYLILDDSIQKASKVAVVLGKTLTDKRELYDFLVKVPIKDLVKATMTVHFNRPRSELNAYFLPVVEKIFPNVEPFFTEHPFVAIRENRFQKVPMLTTTNKYEGAFFFTEKGKILYEKDLHFLIPKYEYKIVEKTKKMKSLERKIQEFYLKSQEIGDHCKEDYVKMVSDSVVWQEVMAFAEIVSQFWDKIYVLQFDYSGNMNSKVLPSLNIKGSTHGDMIPYQFYIKGKASKAIQQDWQMVEFLSEVLCNFAKTGDPTWPNQKERWLPYTKEKRHALIVDDNVKLVENHALDRIEFWNELAKEYYNLAAKL